MAAQAKPDKRSAFVAFIVRAIKIVLLVGFTAIGSFADGIQGSLSNPNSVAEISFTLTAASNVTIQSFGFGGGINGNGATIPGGGFLEDVSLFGPTNLLGLNPLLADTNNVFNGCPPANTDSFEGLCGDSTLSLTALAAGTYILTVAAAPNFPLGPFLQNGFNSGGSFIGNFGEQRTANYAVDISSPTLVPEPATILLLATGLAPIALIKRRLRRSR